MENTIVCTTRATGVTENRARARVACRGASTKHKVKARVAVRRGVISKVLIALREPVIRRGFGRRSSASHNASIGADIGNAPRDGLRFRVNGNTKGHSPD